MSTVDDLPDLDGGSAAHPDFRRELESLINRHNKENGSDTPDFILADHLLASLEAFDHTTKLREHWYGRTKDIIPSTMAAAEGTKP